MEVSQESPRVRWLGLVALWAVIAVLLVIHSAAFKANLELANHVGLRGAAVSPTPMKRVCPTMYADALMWVRHALRLQAGDGPQMRYTYADNAPYGREVHWNSGFAWLILGGGELRRAFTGEPLSVAIEQSMAWFNVPLLLGFVILVTTWVTRRAGLAAGVFLGFAMVGYDDFYSGFSPNYVDHHGILAVAVLGLFLGAIFMGAGFWRTPRSNSQLLPPSLAVARAGAVASALFGAMGMWVSAATLIPAIAIIGIAGVVAMLLHGGRVRDQGVHAEPDLWRLWGKVGGLACLGFYLLEYAPFHLGFRLEVNHPAYAAGWWGGSEVIAQLVTWRCQEGRKFKPRWGRLLAAAIAMSIAPTIIAIGGERVFVVFDPFITRLSRHVAEGISMFQALTLFGPLRFIPEWTWMGISLLAGLVAWWRTRSADRLVLAFTVLAVVAFAAMAVSQLRWAPSAAGPEMCLIVLAIATMVGPHSPGLRWLAIGAGVCGLCLPWYVMRVDRLTRATAVRAIDKTDAMQPIYRDIAAALRASQPEGKIVLLASPNGSVAIGYYGLFETIGTLYWENLDGTKAAAKMFSAQTEAEARRRVRSRGVTHIAFVSEDNFLAEYFDLLHPEPVDVSLQASFGYRTLVDLAVPLWLEQVPYAVPSDSPYRPDRILLFKTKFSNAKADAAYEEALVAADASKTDVALAKLDEAIAAAPDFAEFWVAKANLLLNTGRVPEAQAAVRKAVVSADEAQRFTIANAEGTRFYHARQAGMAAELYRKALATRNDPNVANNLAWLLATTPDDAVRNGQDALKLSAQLVQEHREPAYLNAYAAALAEVGRFPEALTIAREVVEALRNAGDAKVLELAEQRAAAYAASKAWRE